jgi:hypothetical protein
MTIVEPEAATAPSTLTDQRPHSATSPLIKRVLVDERTLDTDAGILHEQDGDTLRITFDPAQTTRAVACAFATVIYGPRVRDQFEREAPDTLTEVSLSVDCGMPGSHHQHEQDPYIDARIIDLGLGPIIGFADCDLSAHGLRAEVRKILNAAPKLLALADTLDTMTGAAPEMRTPVPADATPEQAAGMAEIDRIINESGDPAGAARQFLDLIEQEKAETADYVPPTDFDTAEGITCAGERGAILKAYLLTPMWEGAPDGPTRLSVFTEPSSEGELDAAGATKLIADLETLLPRLRAMRDVLAAQDGQ